MAFRFLGWLAEASPLSLLTTEGKSPEPPGNLPVHSNRLCDLYVLYPLRGGGQARRPRIIQLFYFYFSACFLELFLGRIGFGLVGAFKHRLRSPLDQRLGFRQPQTGLYFTDSLNDGNLLVRRDGSDDHVKLGLRFSGWSSSPTGSSTAGRSSHHWRCGGHTPFCFELLHQIGDFHHGESAQVIYYFCYVSHVTFQFRRHP